MGEATKQQREVWDLVRRGQQIAFDTAVNLVHGETAPLAPGMCFSDEPGIYIPASFGVRLEDCVYMTQSGPKWFSLPATSMGAPFG